MARPSNGSQLKRLGPHADVAAVGGKAASIARLLELGATVPPTWLIPMDVLRRHVQKLGVAPLAKQIERLDDGPGRWRLARQLQSHLLNSELPTRLDAELLELFDSTSAVDGWAVRASASCESVAGASFAGQFATYLGVRLPATARTAVRACWASLWSPRSLAYAGSSSLSRTELGLAIVVQPLIGAQASGAARSVGSQVEIEAAWGLGTTVLSGLVEPDRLRIDLDGRVRSQAIGSKMMRAAANDGEVELRPNPAFERSRMCLSEADAASIARLVRRVSDLLGGPIELEWAHDAARLWALQCRPTQPAAQLSPGPRESPSSMCGIAAAPGQAVGVVRIVRTELDLGVVQPEDVVVTPYFTPAMAPVFRGAAIVSEAGGSCSHAAAIARERHIPFVAGVARATRVFADGAHVSVDGTRGTVGLTLAPPMF